MSTMQPFGFNVIGHVAANLGVGVVTRQVIALIEQHGYPVAAFDVDLGTRRARDDHRFDHLIRASADELPHSINLFVLGLGALDWSLQKCPESFFDGRRLNAVICFWELPVLSAPRAEHLDQLDVVIGASDYLRQVYQQQLVEATVLQGLVPVEIPDVTPFDRGVLGIPATATAFVFSFDPNSDPERKNPAGVVAAFHRGVGADESAWLVIRVNNAMNPNGIEHPSVATLRQAALGHPRIVFITEPLTYPAVLGLYRACDVYVSLHRAEGLGLGMAEAMALGMPVIATGWSGNLTFMRHTTSCLVRYRLVPVQGSLSAYTERGVAGTAVWAEPDLDHAGAWMKLLAGDRERRITLGRAAAEALADFNREAGRARFLGELIALHEQRSALARSGYIQQPHRSGRPVLTFPPAPLLERSRSAAASLSRRVVNRKRKFLGNRPPPGA